MIRGERDEIKKELAKERRERKEAVMKVKEGLVKKLADLESKIEERKRKEEGWEKEMDERKKEEEWEKKMTGMKELLLGISRDRGEDEREPAVAVQGGR